MQPKQVSEALGVLELLELLELVETIAILAILSVIRLPVAVCLSCRNQLLF